MLSANSMLRNLKLGTNLISTLLLVFICGVSISGVAFSNVSAEKAQAEVASKAMTLMQTMTAVRNYTNTHINPLLASRLETESVFIQKQYQPRRNKVLRICRNEGYNNFFTKRQLNQLICGIRLIPSNHNCENFRQNQEPKKFLVFSILTEECFTLPGLLLLKESCLRCHSTPEAAQSQLANPRKEKMVWLELNEIVASQIISVPAEEVLQVQGSIFILIGILIGILL